MELNGDLITPVGDKLLVEVEENATTTDGGMTVVNGAGNTAPVMGTIVKAGEKSKYAPGTVVMFRRYTIDELKITTAAGEQTAYFLEDADILATVGGGDLSAPNKYAQVALKKQAAEAPPNDAIRTKKESCPLEEEAGSSQEASPKEGEDQEVVSPGKN